MPSLDVQLSENPANYLSKSVYHQEESGILDNMSPDTGKSTFLQRLKYFEQKTNDIQGERRRSQSKTVELRRPSTPSSENSSTEHAGKLSIKTTINNARRQFPKENEVFSNQTAPNNYKRLSDTSENATTDLLRKNSADSTKGSVKRLSVAEQDIPVNYGNVVSSRNSVSSTVSSNSHNSPLTPARKLSIKSTINNARDRLSKIYDSQKSPADFKEAKPFSDDLRKPTEDEFENEDDAGSTIQESNNSYCDEFFSSGSSKVLVDEVYTKQFRIVMRGYLYQNFFYSLKHCGEDTYYDLDDYDYFDFGLSASELFNVYAT